MTTDDQSVDPASGAVKAAAPRPWQWIVMLTAAVTVRAALALSPLGGQAPTIADARDYDRLAATLLETGDYATPSGDFSSLRPPLYPAALSVVYGVFGQNYFAVTVAQSAISLATVLLTYRLATRLYDRRVGFAAATILAFYPSLLIFNCLTLSETLFTCLLTGAVVSSLGLLRAPSWRDAAALGLFLGLGALTRSVLWLCAAPVAALIVLLGDYPFKHRVAVAAVSLAVFAAVLAPWAWRNTRVHETFTLVDVMGGRNVMMGNYEHTPLERSWATITDVTGDRAWHSVLAAQTPGYGDLTQGQIDKLAMAYGIRYFFAHPMESAKRCVVRFFNFWQLERTFVAGMRQGIFGEFSSRSVLAAAALFCGAYAAVVLLAIFGGAIHPPAWRPLLLVLLWIAIPCAVHTVAFAHSRYHLPLVPLLAPFASAMLLRCRCVPTDLLTWRGAAAAAACVLLILGWVRELVVVDFAQLF